MKTFPAPYAMSQTVAFDCHEGATDAPMLPFSIACAALLDNS